MAPRHEATVKHLVGAWVREQDGSAMEVKTVCPYCAVGCGLVLRTEAGRVTGLRPDPGHPVSRGTLCPKGATAHEFVHHPDRLTAPLIREKEHLVPTTWERAYGAITREFTRIRQAHGPRALGVISSARATVEENYLAQKFARAVLGTNNVDQCYRICHSASVVGLTQSLGSGGMTNSIREFGEPGPRVLMIVGSNTPHSHPILWSVWIKRALKAGTRLVVVDPRRTEPARLAAVHLAARPGTEIMLFNAMAQHILANDWHDATYIAARCEGFEPMREAVARCPPEVAARVCGVSAEAIKEAAQLYARGKPAMIAYGLGVTEHRSGVDNVRALANLCLITGNVGKLSSGINALRGQNNVQGATDMCRPESLPGYQSWQDAEAVRKFERAWEVKLPVPAPDEYLLYCSRMWEAALEGTIKGLYVMGSDPALTEGNAAKVRRALESLEFLVVQEVFPSETTRLAHVVLPSASYAEKDGTFVNTERRVQRVRKAIDPIGESKPDWQILVELADRMRHSLGVASNEEAFEEIRRLVPTYAGITYARLDEHAGLQWPCPTPDHPGTPILHETTFHRGRALLHAIDPYAPAETPDAEYPFILTTGRTFFQYNCGTMTRRTRMDKGDPASFVELSSEDARNLGVRAGERVRVSTRRGAVVVKARVVDIAWGVIWMPFHFAEAPANLLTNDVVDPQCGITELKACAARIDRA